MNLESMYNVSSLGEQTAGNHYASYVVKWFYGKVYSGK